MNKGRFSSPSRDVLACLEGGSRYGCDGAESEDDDRGSHVVLL